MGAYLAYAAICLIWGTTFVAIRVAIETVPTLLVSGIRFVAAGLMLLLIATPYTAEPTLAALQMHLSIPFFLAVGATQLNAVCWNAGSLYSRRHPSSSDPMANAVVQMLSGGMAVLTLAFILGERPRMAMFSLRSTIALAYLALFGSVIAYTAYNYALSKLSFGKVSTYAYVNPAVAVVVGALLLSEPVTVRMIVAMLVILTGVWVMRRAAVPAAVTGRPAR